MDNESKRLLERYSLAYATYLGDFFQRKNPNLPAKALLCIANPADKPGGGANPRTDIAPLPFARQEGEAISHLFSPMNSALLSGPAADSDTVRKQMESYAILHFAAPGQADAGSGMQSFLALAAPHGSEERFGALHARDILGMSLSARMVVLSAFPLAQESIPRGVGLMGLVWAFQAAGCPCVVTSQWIVNDRARSDLMLAFYQQLKEGKPKDEALQIAMLGVMRAKNPEYAAPYYWAAFQIIGDTSSLTLNGFAPR